jgi:hypothetical protein
MRAVSALRQTGHQPRGQPAVGGAPEHRHVRHPRHVLGVLPPAVEVSGLIEAAQQFGPFGQEPVAHRAEALEAADPAGGAGNCPRVQWEAVFQHPPDAGHRRHPPPPPSDRAPRLAGQPAVIRPGRRGLVAGAPVGAGRRWHQELSPPGWCTRGRPAGGPPDAAAGEVMAAVPRPVMLSASPHPLRGEVAQTGGGASGSHARQAGLEPATRCLEGSRSIRLSYWRIGEHCARQRSHAGYAQIALCRTVPLTVADHARRGKDLLKPTRAVRT